MDGTNVHERLGENVCNTLGCECLFRNFLFKVHFKERFCLIDSLKKNFLRVRETLSRIFSLRNFNHTDTPLNSLQHHEGSLRRLPSSSIIIETEIKRIGNSLENTSMVGRHGRTRRGHHLLDLSLMASDHIEVSLYQDHPLLVSNRLLGLTQTEEHLALFV